MKKVYVVTGVHLGWDCVVDVFDAEQVSLALLKEVFEEENYVIFENTINNSVEDWKQ